MRKVVSASDTSRDANGRWLPGTASPNPSGRPKVIGKEHLDECKRILAEGAPDGARELLCLIRNPNVRERTKIEAIRLMFDFVLQKPPVAKEEVVSEDERFEQLVQVLKNTKDGAGS